MVLMIDLKNRMLRATESIAASLSTIADHQRIVNDTVDSRIKALDQMLVKVLTAITNLNLSSKSELEIPIDDIESMATIMKIIDKSKATKYEMKPDATQGLSRSVRKDHTG